MNFTSDSGHRDCAERQVEVLECDPLNPEMLALQRNIVKELKGAEAAERGLKLIELDRDEREYYRIGAD